MRKIAVALTVFASLFLTGCGNLSPRDSLNPHDNLSPKLQQDINNQQGRIDRIENNQNAIKAEIDKLALFSRENNNNGVQILQGDGGLFLIFGLVTIFLILYYLHRVAEGYRKTAEILAEEITQHKDSELEQKVLKAAQYTDVEEKVHHLLLKRKKP